MADRTAHSRDRARNIGSAEGRQELRVVLTGSAELVSLRRQLRELLVAKRVTQGEREAIVLATEEAANNALLACQASGCEVDVIVSLVSDHVCVEVRDAGVGTSGVCLNLAKIPDEGAEHGRGLYLMGQLMESLECVPRSRGTLVRMTRRLRRLESADPPDAGRLAS